jgi:acetyl-CoA acetyltransferase
MFEYGTTETDLAELAVLMRKHACMHTGAQFREPVTVEAVLGSKPIASPLKLLDCCPVSDGGAAFVVSRARTNDFNVKIRGTGQAHPYQHISAAPSLTQSGAAPAMAKALGAAGVKASDANYAAIYDSFTITLTILLDELGLAPRGRREIGARWTPRPPRQIGPTRTAARFPTDTGGRRLAHLVETHRQLTNRVKFRQAKNATRLAPRR